MKITFLGLSCFLLENEAGDRLLIDPFYDTPDLTLGLRLPEKLQADVFLASHPDADHANLRQDMIRKKRDSYDRDMSDGISVFPNLNIKGTLVKEYNGDICIAWHFSIDGIRFLHLADNAHVLSDSQLKEIGTVDVLMISVPKAEFHTHRENIELLKPKIVIPFHYIPVILNTEKEKPSEAEVKDYLLKLVEDKGITNPEVNMETSDHMSYMFFQALALSDNYSFHNVWSEKLKIKKEDLPEEIDVYMFRRCLGREY